MGEGRKLTLQRSITPQWQRRAAAAVILFGLVYPIILIVELWTTASTLTLQSSLPAILSVAALVCGLVSYWYSRFESSRLMIHLSYILILMAIAAHVFFGPDNLVLIDVTLWSLITIFAATFGLGMVLVVLTLAVCFITYNLLLMPIWFDPFSSSLSALLPVLVSALLWRHNSKQRANQKSQVSNLQSQLGTEEAKNDIVIESITDGVIAINFDGNIHLINPAATRLTGWEKADAIGLKYDAVIKLRNNKQGAMEGSLHPVYEVLNNKTSTSRDDCELITASNKKIPISLHVSPLGHQSGAIVVFRNISDEILENRQKAEFISTASHEMRTPVAAIEGYIGLALNPQTATVDDKASQYLQKAQQSAKHLGRLFQDLLDISRAEDGRLNVNPQTIDITSTLRQFVQELTPMATAKNLSLKFKPDESIGTSSSIAPVYYVNIDVDHLREITSNLIENAVKYTPSGEVTVNVTSSGDHVLMSVADTGIGIAKEDISHLFQKFYRIDNSDTREIGGTGLGLYLCRRLAEANGGRLWVESERGKGSLFVLELNRIQQEQAQAPQSDQPT